MYNLKLLKMLEENQGLRARGIGLGKGQHRRSPRVEGQSLKQSIGLYEFKLLLQSRSEEAAYRMGKKMSSTHKTLWNNMLNI